MAVYTIDTSHIGTTIGGPGAVTRIEVVTLPDRGENQTTGAFTLADNSGPNPRQIYRADADNVGRIAGRSLWRNRGAIGGSGFAEILSQYPIAFGSLLIASVPRGSTFELEVQ
jgi:hypothetical protein